MLKSDFWLFFFGGTFIVLVAYLTKTAPDARFFLPGIPFVLLPFVEKLDRFPKNKLIVICTVALSILQGSYVIKKAYDLRHVSSGLEEGIEYLKNNPPSPNRVFMYPEGNYRLFPSEHEWYLGYRLREFWRVGIDDRLEMLEEFDIGAIVVKKRLIAEVDEEITNLGVYPVAFVSDLLNDARFTLEFENEDLLVFSWKG